MKSFGPLYAKASTGKIKTWQAIATSVCQKQGLDKGFLTTRHGYIDGIITDSEKEIKGKNLGKANQTTPYEQACAEAQSKMNKKMDEGYVLDQKELTGQVLTLPMLAQKYIERKHKIIWPAFCQPKLNGVRCLADYDPTYLSRKGKEYITLDHLDAQVQELLNLIGKDLLLDGEIFRHDWSFQEIIRAVKKYRPGVSEQLQYWVYDIVDTENGFRERNITLQEAFCKLHIKPVIRGAYKYYGNLVLVPTFYCENEKEMMINHKIYTRDNFEGTIIRNTKGKYELKNRSIHLQKYKDFLDSEYTIVGGKEATGNDIGTVVFICETSSGKQFSVRPIGSREARRKWLTKINSIIGKQLIVRYQELSEDGVPIFPVGLAIRDYE